MMGGNTMTPKAPQVLTKPMATPGLPGQLSRAELKMPAKGSPAIMPVKIMPKKITGRTGLAHESPAQNPPKSPFRKGGLESATSISPLFKRGAGGIFIRGTGHTIAVVVI